MASECDGDIDGILDRIGIPLSVKEEHLAWAREVMTEAWQFGYTTGMRDCVALDGSTLAAIESSTKPRCEIWHGDMIEPAPHTHVPMANPATLPP